jgi:hypothetical protein
MRKRIVRLFSIFLWTISVCEGSPFVARTADGTADFCGFPHAWTARRGHNLKIGVLCHDLTDGRWGKAQLVKLAPESIAHQMTTLEFLSGKQVRPKVVSKNERGEVDQALETIARAGVSPVSINDEGMREGAVVLRGNGLS